MKPLLTLFFAFVQPRVNTTTMFESTSVPSFIIFPQSEILCHIFVLAAGLTWTCPYQISSYMVVQS